MTNNSFVVICSRISHVNIKFMFEKQTDNVIGFYIFALNFLYGKWLLGKCQRRILLREYFLAECVL